MKKTKVYYTINGVPYYNEFDKNLPENFDLYQVKNKNIPGNLFDLLFDEKENYKFCRDDGPAVDYFDGKLIFKSSKCEDLLFFYDDNYSGDLSDYCNNTNHLTCSSCNKFCKQRCFI